MIRVRLFSKKIIEGLAEIGEAVFIPQTLVEKLKPFGPHFLKVAKPVPGDSKSGKNATERGFPDRQLIHHFKLY